MLKGFPDAEGHIKHQVKMLLAEEAGESTKDAFLLLKGLCDALPSKATETLLLSIGEDLVLSSEEYGDEVLALAEKAKANQNPMGWLICGSLFHQRGEDEKALRDLREYLSLGGEATDEVTGLLEMLERNQKAERAYELLAEDPAQALVSFNDCAKAKAPILGSSTPWPWRIASWAIMKKPSSTWRKRRAWILSTWMSSMNWASITRS